ncbi:hypothetical protein OESDEN_12476 [Oesophagostomum dentatum]|uniref:Secreted protein n=1 Tax=Oesophagostomum dentatum TaxID=61180 RepID=A0A0B1SW51_OESDE|nr:hypothetical protein OESDEN_12476 [Oesophagostomum dentatum]
MSASFTVVLCCSLIIALAQSLNQPTYIPPDCSKNPWSSHAKTLNSRFRRELAGFVVGSRENVVCWNFLFNRQTVYFRSCP